LASFCTVTASVLIKKIASNNSTFYITGISQLAGGIFLTVIAIILGANFLSFNWVALGVFVYICTASTIAYLLWNNLIKSSELSNMFIIKFAEPLFACVFGAILLGEDIFKVQYLLAFILISAGIILANAKNKSKENYKEEIK
jgi:drug/metabolite transporter (DMT)-like permease